MRRRMAILPTIVVVAALVVTLDSGATSTASVASVSAAHEGGASAEQAILHGGGDRVTPEDNDNDEQNVSNLISPSQMAQDAGTAGARPGWGCGDKNHDHSGPPGRPGASPPPGCTKNR